MKKLKPRNVFLIGVSGCYLVPTFFGLLFAFASDQAIRPEVIVAVLIVVPLFLVIFGLPVILAMTWVAYRASNMSKRQEKSYMLRKLCFCSAISLAAIAGFVAVFRQEPPNQNLAILCGSWFLGYVTLSLSIVLFIRTCTLAIKSRRARLSESRNTATQGRWKKSRKVASHSLAACC